MTKKIGLALILAIIAAGGIFGQEKKNAVSLDTIPLVKGIIASDSDADSFYIALSPAYERVIASHYTLVGRTDFIFGNAAKEVGVFYFGMAAHGRWYPLSSGLEKLYLDVGLGFNTLSIKGDNQFTGLTIELQVGWKHFMGPVFLEPSLGYVIAKSGGVLSVPTPIGWQPGLAFGVAF